jgi:hypothetical protein
VVENFRRRAAAFHLNPHLVEREARKLQEFLASGPTEIPPGLFDPFAVLLGRAAQKLGHSSRGVALSEPEMLKGFFNQDPEAAAHDLLEILGLPPTMLERARWAVKSGDERILRNFLDEHGGTRTRLAAADRLVKRDPAFGLFCLIEALQDEQGKNDHPAEDFLRSLGIDNSLIAQCRHAISPAQCLVVAKLLADELNL